MKVEQSDGDLINKYLKGDETSLSVLFARHLDTVYRFALQLSGDSEKAEDITQEAFVRVWKNLNKFDQSKKFKTWILAIAKNAAIDIFRKEKSSPFADFATRNNEGPLEDTLISQELDPAENFELKELAHFLEAELMELPLSHRTVLQLYYFEELNFREISEILEISIETIKSHHRRGIQKLRSNSSPNLLSQ